MSKLSESYVIIGAGIMGLCTAWALSRAGVKEITLIEQSTIPNPVGASGDQHRIIRRAYGLQSAYGFMISDAFEAWNTLWQDLGKNHLDMRGFAILSREDGDEGADYIAGLENDGFSFQELGQDALSERFPFVSQKGLLRAVFSEEGGILYSHRIALGLKKLLEQAGVKLIENAKVQAIDNDVVTYAGGEKIKADRIIVTAGAWVQKTCPQKAEVLQPRQTYAVFLQAPKEFEAAWQKAPPFLDVGNFVDGYVLPPGNGCELKFGSGLTRSRFDPQRLEQAVSDNEAEYLREAFGQAFINTHKYEILHSRRCAYTFTSDNRFWANQQGRITIVSACSGHGYKFGSVIGLRLADSILKNEFDAFAAWLSGNTR